MCSLLERIRGGFDRRAGWSRSESSKEAPRESWRWCLLPGALVGLPWSAVTPLMWPWSWPLPLTMALAGRGSSGGGGMVLVCCTPLGAGCDGMAGEDPFATTAADVDPSRATLDDAEDAAEMELLRDCWTEGREEAGAVRIGGWCCCCCCCAVCAATAVMIEACQPSLESTVALVAGSP